MQTIRRDDILDTTSYNARRDELRRAVMAEKARRRLRVGQHVTLLFETYKTLWYQVQEMIRAEGISDEAAIAHEIETYNELLAGPGQLSATMLIEYEDVSERNVQLRALVGIKDHVWLELGGRRVLASFDERQMETERVSSVQFIRFDLGGVSADEFRAHAAGDGGVRVVIDHPRMYESARIDGDVAEALAEDLAAAAS